MTTLTRHVLVRLIQFKPRHRVVVKRQIGKTDLALVAFIAVCFPIRLPELVDMMILMAYGAISWSPGEPADPRRGVDDMAGPASRNAMAALQRVDRVLLDAENEFKVAAGVTVGAGGVFFEKLIAMRVLMADDALPGRSDK